MAVGALIHRHIALRIKHILPLSAHTHVTSWSICSTPRAAPSAANRATRNNSRASDSGAPCRGKAGKRLGKEHSVRYVGYDATVPVTFHRPEQA